MQLPQLVYECDQCGACCRHSIIEVDHLDVLREPLIAERGTHMDGNGKVCFEDSSWSLNRHDESKSFACVFLGDDNRCGIYGARPSVCVEFQAGSGKCQERRASAGLPPLTGKPVDAPTVIDRIRALARE